MKRKKHIKLRRSELNTDEAGGTPSSREKQFKPKRGPGQQFVRESVAQVGGGHARSKRYRNVAVSPLRAAFHRGQLTGANENDDNRASSIIVAQDRLECGEKFEEWWKTLMGSGYRDSTQQSTRGNQIGFSELQEAAGRKISEVRTKMTPKNYLVCEALCGCGFSMIESLRFAGLDVHPVGTAYRIREALDDLVCVMTGRQMVPILVPTTKVRAWRA